jgi:PAS domain S-box-containing protein
VATILVIEDRPVDRKLLTIVLRSGGNEVIEASDGEEALGIIQRDLVDLVISDILMPTVDGYEFVRRLRELPSGGSTPVIFYTATYHEREARALADRCGVSAILTKPSHPDAILDTVNRVLQTGPKTSPPVPDASDFNREHLQVISTTLAARMAELEDGRQRMSALVDIAQQVSAERDPERLLRHVCSAARDVTLAQHAVISVLNESRSQVEGIVTSGMERATADRIEAPPTISSFWRTVVDDRRPIRVRGDVGRPDAFGLPPGDAPLNSVLSVPIASPSRVYGWLSLCNKLGSDEFTEVDEEVAITLGSHAAVAYENAQLYADLQRHLTALEHEVADRRRAEHALRLRSRLTMFSSAVGTALTASATVPVVLQACVDAAVQHLDAAVARLWILSDGGDQLVPQASASATGIEPDEARPVRMRDPGIGEFARTMTPRVNDPRQIEPAAGDREWCARERMTIFAGYPLIVDARLVGFFGLYGHVPWSPEALDAISDASREIALGIERRLVEARLRQNEERTRFALTAARMGIWEMDLTNNELLSADTLRPLFGIGPDEGPADLQTFEERIDPEDRAMVAQELARAIAARRDYAVTFRVRWPDGSIHWIDGRGHLICDDAGRPVRFLGVSLDVSERKALEAQFLQAQKMEGIGQLAGGVAHDFNNLLTAILGYSMLLSESIAPDSPECRDVEEIIKATERAAGLTRQLLAFSRKQVFEPAIVHINTLIRDMTQMLGRLIGEDIELVTVLAPDLAPVRADAGQIQQVVMNLAVNARDAMPGGGQLLIETENVELDDAYLLQHAVARSGRYMRLTVSDTGVGIPDEIRSHLFEPFFTTKEKGRGTGLGLATVYGVVQQSAGYVWVYSEPGQGATFKVYLPASEGPHDEPVASRSHVTSRGSELLLVIEDEDAVRRLASLVLRRAGYRVFEAAGAIDAEELITSQDQPFDLVISDVVMPGSSGPALFDRLAGRQPSLKVLYMSGYTDDAVIRHGRLEAGAAFLQKPFTGEVLLRKVREVLDR